MLINVVQLFKYKLLLLKYELTLFSYFKIFRDAQRNPQKLRMRTLRPTPAGQLTIIAYTHVAGHLPSPLPYTSVEKLFHARSTYFS